MIELIRKILNEEVPPQVRRRIPNFEETFKHYRNAFSKYTHRNFNIYWNAVIERVSETLYHAWFVNTVPDNDWEESEKYIQDYLTKKYKDETKQMWQKKRYKRLNESEEKNQSLLSLIKEHGLFEFIKMTGLSLPEIYTKTGELPREVFERYIKDFINEEGYHQTDGSVQLRYETEIQTHVYIDHFYMEGDRITVEIKRLDNFGKHIEGYIESLSNLTDDEISNLAQDMILWGGEGYY